MRRFLSRFFGHQAATTRRGRPANATRPPLAVEALEDRWVPSTLQVVNGVLTYTASDGVANNVGIALSGANYVITDAAETISAPNVPGNGTHTVTVPAVLVDSMRFDLRDQADALVVESTVDPISAQGGDGDDTFTVRATAAGTTTTLLGGAGADSFNVGSVANTLDDVKGTLVLNGGSDPAIPDTVNLFDQGSAVSNTYLVRDTSVTRSGGVVIVYREMERLTLGAGAAADGVVATSPFTPVTLNMGGGDDVVDLGTRTGTSLDLIRSAVTVNGEGGTDTVNLNDQTDANANSYVVTATGVTRNGAGILNYGAVENLILNAGAFADAAAVQGTPAGTRVALRMGAGDDAVSVGSAGGSLDPVLGAVTVDGQAGADRLLVNDGGDSDFNLYTITAADVTRQGSAPVAYAGTEDLTVNASSATPLNLLPSNFFVVKSTSVATTLNGAAFVRNGFLVGNSGNSLDDVRGALTLNAQGRSTIVLSDDGETTPNTYTVTETTVARSGAALISYFSADLLDVAAGPADDTFNVTGTSFTPVTLNTGGGNDTVTLGGGFLALDSLTAPVTVNGGPGVDAIVVNDQTAAFGGHNYQVTSTEVNRDNRKLLIYSAAESLALNAGPADDTIRVESTLATTPVVVRGGPGNDTLQVGTLSAAAIQGALTLDGQGGADAVDYSAFNSANPVRVNLALGTATGVAGGLGSIENVTGGPGDDVLVGDDQANVLHGGPGRDVLIGRGGADTLFGEAGNDVLIGGSTDHDLNADALEDVMREWERVDGGGTPFAQYLARIAHLMGPTPDNDNDNGTTFLNLSTVTDDGVADSLNGGSELDWFWMFGADTALRQANERVN
jgi:Ca2+-binding RTX toxin-like protein